MRTHTTTSEPCNLPDHEERHPAPLVESSPDGDAPESQSSTAAPSMPPDGPGLVTRRLADVPRETIKPFFGGRLLLGKLSALGGVGGVGKSFVTGTIAAAVSRGELLAGDDTPTGPADVLLASFEDGVGDTIRPRLEDLGADLDRVSVIEGTAERNGSIRPFTPSDVDALEAEVLARDTVRLVIIDPVGGWLGSGVDAHRENEVRAALQGVNQLAAQCDLAVLLVMHMRKAPAANLVSQFLGSVGWGNLVRSALVARKDPDDESQAVLLHEKDNLTGRAPALGYCIDDDGQFHWLGERPDLDAESTRRGADEQASAATEAETFLLALLSHGPRLAQDVMNEARDNGVADRTLKRAKQRLGVSSTKDGPGGAWMWSLPDVREE